MRNSSFPGGSVCCTLLSDVSFCLVDSGRVLAKEDDLSKMGVLLRPT